VLVRTAYKFLVAKSEGKGLKWMHNITKYVKEMDEISDDWISLMWFRIRSSLLTDSCEYKN
jgi:hypothetical protein